MTNGSQRFTFQGEDTFSIDHGQDYFSFFRRMGEVEYVVAKDRKLDRVVAVGAGVLRQIPLHYNKQDELTEV
jgi:hypothetical protein